MYEKVVNRLIIVLQKEHLTEVKGGTNSLLRGTMNTSVAAPWDIQHRAKVANCSEQGRRELGQAPGQITETAPF